MTDPERYSDDELQEFLDNRLDDQRRAEIAAYLQANPQKAAELDALRLQDEALRGLGADILNEPVPQRLTAAVRGAGEPSIPHPPRAVYRHRYRFVEVAAALFIFVLGGGVGWLGHGLLQRGPDELELVLADTTFAFSVLLQERDQALEYRADQEAELQAIVERIYRRAITRPDLSARGYSYVGAKVLPGARRQVCYLLFENGNGSRISVAFWPSTLAATPKPKRDRVGDFLVDQWQDDGVGFALLRREADRIPDDLANDVIRFYRAGSS